MDALLKHDGQHVNEFESKYKVDNFVNEQIVDGIEPITYVNLY